MPWLLYALSNATLVSRWGALDTNPDRRTSISDIVNMVVLRHVDFELKHVIRYESGDFQRRGEYSIHEITHAANSIGGIYGEIVLCGVGGTGGPLRWGVFYRCVDTVMWYSDPRGSKSCELV